MTKNIGYLVTGDIRRTWHIGSPAKLNRGIRQNPLESVIGEYRNVIPRRNAQFNQCRGKRDGSLFPLTKRDGMECPVGTTGREGRGRTPPIPRLHEEGGEVRYRNPSGHESTETM